MGTLSYGNAAQAIPFDDRALAHIQIVVAAKLRRSEGFFFTWQHTPALGSGHSSIWLDSSIPLVFRYSAGAMPGYNREWLERLTLSANGVNGLHLVPEPRPAGSAASSVQPSGARAPRPESVLTR